MGSGGKPVKYIPLYSRHERKIGLNRRITGTCGGRPSSTTGLGFRVGNYVENNVRGKRLERVLVFGQVISVPSYLTNGVRKVGFGLASVKDGNLVPHSDEVPGDVRAKKVRGSDGKNLRNIASRL